jgi:hypothetical protein
MEQSYDESYESKVYLRNIESILEKSALVSFNHFLFLFQKKKKLKISLTFPATIFLTTFTHGHSA